jgi:hypothetical protein
MLDCNYDWTITALGAISSNHKFTEWIQWNLMSRALLQLQSPRLQLE